MQCNCCGSFGIVELDVFRDYHHFKCNFCDYEFFVQKNSLILSDLYENDADYIDDLNVWTNPEDLILWHHLKTIKFLKNNFQKNSTILDVGCFNGFFVKKLVQLGYDAQGLDFNKNAISYGQEKFGLSMRISTKSLEDLFDQGLRFDVITLFEVLEHLPDPKNFLYQVSRLLNDKGIIIVSTPNNKMFWRPVLDYPPHHLSRFTTKALEACLSQIGMLKIYSEEQMSLYELIRHYLGTFFRAKDSVSLRGGEFKNKKLTISLRRGVNKLRKILGILLTPIDMLLHMFGFRYISQIVVAEKRKISKF